MTTLKTKIKSAINADQSKAWLDHLKKLVVQGDLLNLAHSEESDLTWNFESGCAKFKTGCAGTAV